MTPCLRIRVAALAAAALAALALPATVAAQATPPWPSRPITLVVPFPPGGSSDIAGRLVADRLGKALGAQVVVMNRPGGTTQIGTEAAARAAPDGYTWLLSSDTSFTVLPNLRKLGYGLDSFDAIGNFCEYVGVLAVRPGIPARTMAEFVDHARRNPGKLAYGSAGEASVGHVMGGALARAAGLDVLHVPFKGSAEAVTAAVGGEVDFVIDGAATAMVRSGRLVALAAFYKDRHPELPQVPTAREAGFDLHYGGGAGKGLMVPRGTPPAIVERISAALKALTDDPAFQQDILKANYVAAWADAPTYAARLKADAASNATLLPALGVKGL